MRQRRQDAVGRSLSRHVAKDGSGNASGYQFDLAVDGAFASVDKAKS
jgi:hypothetical protein